MLMDEFGRKVNEDVLEKNIVFYGASTRNQKVIDGLDIADKVLFFVDGDDKRAGQKLGQYPIKTVESISEDDDIMIVSVLIEHREDIVKRLHQYGKSCYFYIFEQFDIEKMVRNNEDTLQAGSNYKYIHIFSPNIFVEPFYNMAEEAMDISEHLFIVEWRNITYNGYSVFEKLLAKSRKYHNILIFDGVHGISEIGERAINCNKIFAENKIRDIVSSAQKILIHSAFFTPSMMALLSAWAEEYGGKMAWICWGGDSEFDRESYVVQNVLKKLGYAYSSRPRIETIGQKYGIQAQDMGQASYCYIPSELGIYHKNEDGKYILLGHSAAEYGNHMEGLKLLYPWREENIKIWCPLSYGNGDYRDAVIAKGREMFKEKFIPMTTFMETEQYYAFLHSIDVAVFPMTRMAAGTTLMYLSSCGRKIYLNKENIHCFCHYGIHAYDIDLIKEQTFEEFLQSDNGCANTKDNNSVVAGAWQKILDD